MMEILEKIFGSAAKVKIMRLFMYNPQTAYDVIDVEERAKISHDDARKELVVLEKIGLIKRKVFSKDVVKRHGSKTHTFKARRDGFVLDENFYYLTPLQNFLIHINPLRHKDIVNKLSRVGKLKLVIVSGLFIQQPESRIDLLVVGDNIRKSSLESVIKSIEAEIGKELRYTYFETVDFQYRLGMCDKLIRDVLDYPHEKIFDKLSLE